MNILMDEISNTVIFDEYEFGCRDISIIFLFLFGFLYYTHSEARGNGCIFSRYSSCEKRLIEAFCKRQKAGTLEEFCVSKSRYVDIICNLSNLGSRRRIKVFEKTTSSKEIGILSIRRSVFLFLSIARLRVPIWVYDVKKGVAEGLEPTTFGLPKKQTPMGHQRFCSTY